MEVNSYSRPYEEAKSIRNRIEELSVRLGFYAAKLKTIIWGGSGSLQKNFEEFYNIFTELYINTAYHHKMRDYKHNNRKLVSEVEVYLNESKKIKLQSPKKTHVRRGIELAFEYRAALHQNGIVEW